VASGRPAPACRRRGSACRARRTPGTSRLRSGARGRGGRAARRARCCSRCGRAAGSAPLAPEAACLIPLRGAAPQVTWEHEDGSKDTTVAQPLSRSAARVRWHAAAACAAAAGNAQCDRSVQTRAASASPRRLYSALRMPRRAGSCTHGRVCERPRSAYVHAAPRAHLSKPPQCLSPRPRAASRKR